MKIAIITDTHYGVRNDNSAFYSHMKKFYDDVFFPTLKKEGIENIIHLGDLIDRRKYINFKTLQRMKKDFISPIFDRNMKMFLVIGNHDLAYKNTSELSSVNELFDKELNLTVFSEPTEYTFGNLDILFLPWINKENREESFAAIKNSKATIAMGHLGITGFEMGAGVQYNGSHGTDPDLSPSDFRRFDIVYSGHFHHPSSDGTISYLGAPFEFTWGDAGHDRGFHIFDTETRALTFIKNPYRMFYSVLYEGQDVDVDSFKGAYVKLIVKDRTDEHKLDQLIDSIENVGVTDLQVIDSSHYIEEGVDEDSFEEGEDTLSILNKYVDQLSTNKVPKDRLSKFVTELFNEALQVE
jgi:DNA repair exonuclease SbcCD nuclease subunit